MNATVVLVHGAMYSPWIFDPLRERLSARGIPSRAVQLPSSNPDSAVTQGLTEDVATVRAEIDSVDGPVVLAAHSYGGVPATWAAADAGQVTELVYIAAFALGPGIWFARGSYTPRDAVTSGQKAIGVGGSGAPLATGPVKWVLPDEATPFMSWGQRAAILKQAENPTAAKLDLNWRLSTGEQQAATNGWSVRTDVTPPTGLKPVWQYPNGNLDGFPRFMADRAGVERWKQTFALYFGEVTGDPSPGRLGLHPGA